LAKVHYHGDLAVAGSDHLLDSKTDWTLLVKECWFCNTNRRFKELLVKRWKKPQKLGYKVETGLRFTKILFSLC
jgi:hypothetical protein